MAAETITALAAVTTPTAAFESRARAAVTMDEAVLKKNERK